MQCHFCFREATIKRVIQTKTRKEKNIVVCKFHEENPSYLTIRGHYNDSEEKKENLA